jgi:hypothetical protein
MRTAIRTETKDIGAVDQEDKRIAVAVVVADAEVQEEATMTDRVIPMTVEGVERIEVADLDQDEVVRPRSLFPI